MHKVFVKRKILSSVFLPALMIMVFSTCTPDKNSNHQDYQKNISFKLSSSRLNSPENNEYNQHANYLAGKKTLRYKKLQDESYYKNYLKKINQSWTKTTAQNLLEIYKWQNQYFKRSLTDKNALFYPFSGPDFLYAQAFFPQARNYIFVGLENPGKLPNLLKMNEKSRIHYLTRLLKSLRYIDKAGYFTTKQMLADFTDNSLNGIIHLLLFYFAKTNYTIIEISSIEINEFGEIKDKKSFQVADTHPNGLRIKFYKNSMESQQKLYYFPFDLSDENLKDYPEFLLFLNNFGAKNTFLKSASYLLHHDDFKIIRTFILKQSKIILQDDSGIPFDILKNFGFGVKLFGNYTRTIKVFSENYQADLQKELEFRKVPPLNFKIGYNSWENETVLMLAEKGKSVSSQPITYKKEKEEIIYKVQFKSSWKKIPLNSKKFKGLPPVDYYFNDGFYKYTIGKCSSPEECAEYMKIAIEKGYIDAFIVAFYKKNRITLEKAEEIRKNKK